ncbi:mucin-5AC-like [Poeciliopsis prolifica]|uniref:mucin-5AC-like n=1 Tax=Poeciliopsis prolifica TaxID=188132 RepID=UPI002412F34D|nr:mucin-5AC-like [Poeciliopsis prolifica]
MALSQVQCLDDNNVNPRISESKPEFFFCEEQRLALEALLRDGREAFAKYLESRGLRGFLSDLEQETLTAALEPFDPGAELFSGEREGEQEPLSLQYWPDVSDTSIPEMDLGWPDSESYKGVTRTTVYTQPPMEGQAHIKEVVRKMIAQAQKVVAVVMDVFTDVDIFRDLLDAGFKRKVSVYILLERTMLPHFLSMCRRANMHAGHLKHLRVRCTEGAEFYTRYCTRVKGQLGHRFMFIDGDKAVSGSYSFTWMSSRLDRNLITVTTGQAVNAFDQVFRYLYVTSSFVDLRQVTTDPEPEPDTRHQVLSVAPPSAAVARKLYNPKYALVALMSPSPANSNSNDSSKEPEVSEEAKNKKRQKRTREDPSQDAPPIHPGLLGLEKACLLSYLPTWPEPDPPSDVIGFINIRDSKRPTQVHLQRSEMFEISQAIKFSSPISKPQETLPDVARPRNRNTQNESKTDGLLVDKAKPEKKSISLVDNNNEEVVPEKNSPLHREKLNFDKSETQVPQMQKKMGSDSDRGPVSLIPHALPQSSSRALTPKNEQPSHEAQIISTTSCFSEPLKESKCVKEPETATVSQTQSTFVDGTKTLKSNTAQKSQLHNQTQLNTEENKIVSHQESHTNAANTQLKISSEETCDTGGLRHIATSPASPKNCESLLSKNNLVTITTVTSTMATSSCNSTPSTSLPLTPTPSTSSFPKLSLYPSSASSFTSSVTPDSKPCSGQLLKQDSVNNNTETTPDIVVEKSKTSLGSQTITDVSALTSLVQTSPVKNLESVPDLQRNDVSKTGHLKQRENTNIPEGTKQETQTVSSQNGSNQESHSKTADTQLKISSEKTCNLQNPGSPGYIATSSATPLQSESSLSKNNPVTITAVASTIGTSYCNSVPSIDSLLIDPPSTSSFPELPLLSSSSSSFTSSVVPDSKPCSEQLLKQDRVNDSTEATPGISVDERSKTSLGSQTITDVSALTSLVQTSPVKNLESGPDLQRNSVSKTKFPKQTENTNISKDTKQETQTVTSQKINGKETDRKHNERGEVQSVTINQLETKSDVYAKDSSSTAILNVNELIPKSDDTKTHKDHIATSTINSTSDNQITNLESAKATNTQTYLARCHEPQIISYSNFTVDDINKAQPSETSTAPTNWISHNTYILKENHDGSINSDANTLSQPGKQAQVPSVDGTIITLNSVKQHTHNTFLKQACITQGGAYSSRKTLHLPFSNVQAMDLSLQTNKQKLQIPAADTQSSAPKVFPSNLPTTNSQTTSPDLQTPTTDISDDYLSSREDSTTSEEYFECSESPSREPVLDTSGWTGKNSSPTNSDCHISRNVGTSSADLGNISSASGLTSSSHSTSSSESSILSWTSREPPTSPLGTKGQNRESKITNRRNSKEGSKIEVNSSNTEKKKERVHQRMEGTDSKELNRMSWSLKKDSDLKEMALKLSKASGGQAKGATADGESVQKETKRLSTGELKPERVSSEGKKSLSSKDKPTNQAALTPGNMEMRQRQSTRETAGQKPLNPSPKSQPRQQPGSRGSSPSQPRRSPRCAQVQAPRPSGIHDLSQTESRALQSSAKEFAYKPPPQKSQSRSPSPMKAAPTGSAAGRKHLSKSQLLTRQPPAAQTRSNFEPPQIQAAKQQASSLYTLSSLQPQAHPLVSTQEVSAQAAQEPEEARVPFNLTLSRLYNFKGLRDKWTKQPPQSRRSSTGTPVKECKDTS